MRFYYHAAAKSAETGLSPDDILRVLERIAEGTETTDLIVAVYLMPGVHRTRGTAYVRHWMTPKEFQTGRGHWGFTRRFPAPDGLPARFKLIRMRLDPDLTAFPRTERDGYHWLFGYRTFSDQIATLFAHELHHYRRHHLGLHPREGEHSANRWALETALHLGFTVEGRPVRRPRKPRSKILALLPGLRRRTDPYAHLKSLKAGAQLLITHDPKGDYAGQITLLTRPVRANAKRVVIRTPDGKTWRWPMAWVKTVE